MNLTLNKQLHALLNATGLTDHKESLVLSYTDKRTAKSSEMRDYEVRQLIKHLQKIQQQQQTKADNNNWEKNDSLRKLIISNWYKIENAQTTEQKAQALKHCLSWIEKHFKGQLNTFNGTELYKIKVATDKVLTDKATNIRRATAHENT